MVGTQMATSTRPRDPSRNETRSLAFVGDILKTVATHHRPLHSLGRSQCAWVSIWSRNAESDRAWPHRLQWTTESTSVSHPVALRQMFVDHQHVRECGVCCCRTHEYGYHPRRRTAVHESPTRHSDIGRRPRPRRGLRQFGTVPWRLQSGIFCFRRPPEGHLRKIGRGGAAITDRGSRAGVCLSADHGWMRFT